MHDLVLAVLMTAPMVITVLTILGRSRGCGRPVYFAMPTDDDGCPCGLMTQEGLNTGKSESA